MKFQSELQQMLLTHSLPSTSTATLAYIESYLHASLTDLLLRLRFLIRRLLSSSSLSSLPSATFDNLILLLLLHNKPLFYRFTLYLSYQETRKKAKESAYGVSELEMPVQQQYNNTGLLDEYGGLEMGMDNSGVTSAHSNNASTPTHRPEDAWDAPTPTLLYGDSALHQTNLSPPCSLQSYPFSIFEEYALPLSDSELSSLLEEQLSNPEKGVLAHFQRLKQMDILTKEGKKEGDGMGMGVGMGLREYGMYTEARQQAGFSHNKIRAKRFKEFIGPQLAVLDIPSSDELLESLGFLSHEIVVDLLERGKGQARERILRQQKRERQEKQKNSTNMKGKKGKGTDKALQQAKRSKGEGPGANDTGKVVSKISTKSDEKDMTAVGVISEKTDAGNDTANRASDTAACAPQAQATTTEITTLKNKEEEDDSEAQARARANAAEAATARALEEDSNLRPTGPFSASFSSLAMAYPTSVNGINSNRLSLTLACPATIDDPIQVPFDDPPHFPNNNNDSSSDNHPSSSSDIIPGGGRGAGGRGSMLPGTSSLSITAQESSKTQSQMPSSDIQSNYDVILGDYEEAVLGMKRKLRGNEEMAQKALETSGGRGENTFGRKRRRGFVDCF